MRNYRREPLGEANAARVCGRRERARARSGDDSRDRTPRQGWRAAAGPDKLTRVSWGGSSAGRASRSQCEGREFDPPPLHHEHQNGAFGRRSLLERWRPRAPLSFGTAGAFGRRSFFGSLAPVGAVASSGSRARGHAALTRPSRAHRRFSARGAGIATASAVRSLPQRRGKPAVPDRVSPPASTAGRARARAPAAATLRARPGRASRHSGGVSG